MSFNKNDIYKALEGITAPGEGVNLIESKAVTNVVVFGKEILVDVTIKNPSLQAKKKRTFYHYKFFESKQISIAYQVLLF